MQLERTRAGIFGVPDHVQVVLLAEQSRRRAERTKLTGQELSEAENEIKRTETKLADAQFRSKAPAHVIEKDEERLVAARSRADGLQQRLKELG